MGERVYETDKKRWKTGNGVTNYNGLDYERTPPTYSLHDFGAVADGTYNAGTHAMTGTDNTAAINAALATGKPVSIPPGLFYYSGILHTSVDGSGLVGSGSGASYLITNTERDRHLCVDYGTQDTTWTGFTMIGPHIFNGAEEGRALVIGTTGGGTGTTSSAWDASGTWIDDFVTRGHVVGVHISVGNDVRFGRIEVYDAGDSRSEPGGYGITCSGSRLVGKTLIAHNAATRGRHALYFTGLASNCHVDYVDAKGFDFAAIRCRATTGGGQGNGFGFAKLEDCNNNTGGGDGSVGGVVQFVCANDVAVTGAGGSRIGDFIAINCGGYPGPELRYMPNSRCGTVQVYGHSGMFATNHYGAHLWNSPNSQQPLMVFAQGFDAAGLNDATLVPLRLDGSAGCYGGGVVAHSGSVFMPTPTYDGSSAVSRVFPAAVDTQWYNTADQATNYERVRAYWTGNLFRINSQAGGTGTFRDIEISIGGAGKLTVKSAGTRILADVTSGNSSTNIMGATGTLTAVTGKQRALHLTPTFTQTGDAAYTALDVDVTDTGSSSGARRLIDAKVGGSSKLYIDSTGAVFIADNSAPSTPSGGGILYAEGGSLKYKSSSGAVTVLDTAHGATSKTTPVDADEIPLLDSTASFGQAKLTFANLKAWWAAVTATLTNKTISLTDNTVTMTAAQLQTAVTDADLVLATAVANRVYGTDASGVARTYDISTGVLAGAVARQTGEGNLVANSFMASIASTVTAAGTTTLTVASVEVQRFTGTTTQIVALPTTSIVAGRPFEFINDSTGAVTVNASGGALVATVAAGGRARVRAYQATPTTAAHWALLSNGVPTP